MFRHNTRSCGGRHVEPMAAESAARSAVSPDDDADDATSADAAKDTDAGGSTTEIDEQRRYNAFICSKIDETWVST